MTSRKKENLPRSTFDDNPEFGIIPLPSTKILHKAYFATIKVNTVASSGKARVVKTAFKATKLQVATRKKSRSTK